MWGGKNTLSLLVLALTIWLSYLSGILTGSVKPETQYVLMIDAGSTGSRIHIFQFSGNQDTLKLEKGDFHQTIPGLSSYSPKEAAESLDELLNYALRTVPQQYHKKTPVSLKATAGLRLLGNTQSADILKAVEARLTEKYPFPLKDVEIMDGKDEAVYAWLTVNYLLGNIGKSNSSEPPRTAAVFDLGGASTQIVFEPDFSISADSEAKKLLDYGDHRYDFHFGNHHHLLYQHSHLGYGLMEARKQIHQKILNDNKTWTNPCISVGQEKNVSLSKNEEVRMVGPHIDSQAHHSCIRYAKEILNLEHECHHNPCAFNGVHQPSLVDTFAEEDIYVVSYFYDRVFQLGLNDTFPVENLRILADTVCKGSSYWKQHFDPETIRELSGRPEWCLDLSFMFSILHYGYGLPLDRKLKVAKQINSYELSWALGAAIQTLSHPAHCID